MAAQKETVRKVNAFSHIYIYKQSLKSIFQVFVFVISS